MKQRIVPMPGFKRFDTARDKFRRFSRDAQPVDSFPENQHRNEYKRQGVSKSCKYANTVITECPLVSSSNPSG